MSVSKEITVWCDRCDTWTHGAGIGIPTTVKDARRAARSAGWTRRRVNGVLVDLCHGCAGQMASPPEAHR